MSAYDNADFPVERLNRIEQYVEQRGNARISELAEAFGVSESTVRRDLDALVREGRIERTHGGAIWVRHSSSYEQAYSEKLMLRMAEKKRIGAACAAMVRGGDTIFLDSGTTTYQIARNLTRKKNLTIFTYDLAIAAGVRFDPTTTVVVTGGVKREDYNVLIGSMAETFIESIRFGTLFLSADAIDQEFGVSNTTLPEAYIKSKLCRQASRVVLAADSTKFGRVAMVRVCGLSEVNAVVTDAGLPEAMAAGMRQAVPDLRIV